MDVVKITEALHTKINATLNTEDVLILSKAIEKLKLGTVKTVAAYSDLLGQFPNNGDVFFVENEERLYYAIGSIWRTIFENGSGIAYGWGSNNGGVGDNTAINRSSPVTVVGGFNDWFQVSSSSYNTVGVRSNGTAWTWGNNTYNSLGSGSALDVNVSSPVLVTGGFTDWKQISVGIGGFSLGLRSNGTAWAWGYDRNTGNLGTGGSGNLPSPVIVTGGFTDWVQLEAASTHSLGLRANGTLWSWGSNNSGQLGSGLPTISSRNSPGSVIGGFTDWVQTSAGVAHSIGIRSNGTAWAWGLNSSGQLGDNTSTAKSSPISIVGGFTNWTQISAGATHNIGLRSNGTLWAWGSNLNGQLGDGTVISKSSPISIIGGFTDWTEISSKSDHAVGVRSNGTAWAWGLNSDGRLGDNTIANKSSPISITGGFTNWIQISASGRTVGIRSV